MHQVEQMPSILSLARTTFALATLAGATYLVLFVMGFSFDDLELSAPTDGASYGYDSTAVLSCLCSMLSLLLFFQCRGLVVHCPALHLYHTLQGLPHICGML